VEGTPNTIGRQHMINGHPEMADKIHVVKNAVENMTIAFKDKKHEDRERIFCKGADQDRLDYYITAAVRYDSKKEATIITAWTTDAISSNMGEITYVNYTNKL